MMPLSALQWPVTHSVLRAVDVVHFWWTKTHHSLKNPLIADAVYQFGRLDVAVVEYLATKYAPRTFAAPLALATYCYEVYHADSVQSTFIHPKTKSFKRCEFLMNLFLMN